MHKSYLIFVCAAGIIITIFVMGCGTAPAKDDSAKNDHKDVRVSGDVTVSTVNREGF